MLRSLIFEKRILNHPQNMATEAETMFLTDTRPAEDFSKTSSSPSSSSDPALSAFPLAKVSSSDLQELTVSDSCIWQQSLHKQSRASLTRFALPAQMFSLFATLSKTVSTGDVISLEGVAPHRLATLPEFGKRDEAVKRYLDGRFLCSDRCSRCKSVEVVRVQILRIIGSHAGISRKG
ncbi:hypothetical protein E4T42_06858 [Aureobasidium subglaciale]|nr:hypothetical protein E4T42_06858 [Aureobasidium subglaciale]